LIPSFGGATCKVEDYDPSDEKHLPFVLLRPGKKMVENVNYSLYLNDLGRKKKK